MLRIPRSKPVTSQSEAPTPPAWRGPVTLLLAPGALIATIAFSCHDKDAIWIVPPDGSGGTSGAPGVAGMGGTSNGGNGGSNMAGAAGNSAGGAAGSGNGGSGGAAGSSNGGSAGSGTAGSTSLPGDAGPDSGGPDSGGPQLTAHQQAATAICALEDQVASCQAPSATCVDELVAQWEGVQGFADPSCAATIDAYFNCQATEPVTSYDCNGTGNTPQFTVPTSGNCSDEEAAFFVAADPSNTCP